MTSEKDSRNILVGQILEDDYLVTLNDLCRSCLVDVRLFRGVVCVVVAVRGALRRFTRSLLLEHRRANGEAAVAPSASHDSTQHAEEITRSAVATPPGNRHPSPIKQLPVAFDA